MTQLTFETLDTEGTNTGSNAEIKWLPVSDIVPHPQNPRLFVRQEVVEGITGSVKEKGFDPCYAVLVRPHEGGYQMISGHHRLSGCKAAGASHIAAWIRDMDDDEAFLELVRGNNQGELKPLEIGLHALQYVEKGSKWSAEGKTLKDYADGISKSASSLTEARQAAKVFYQIRTSEFDADLSRLYDRANHLYQISKAPQEDWEWLVVSLLDEGWSVKQTESAVKAIGGLEIDARLHGWIQPEQYKKQAVSEAVAGNKSDIVERVTRWATTAIDCLNSLDDSRPVWLFGESGEPYREVISPKTLFLERLPSIGHPSDKKIINIQAQILEYFEQLDREYSEWEDLQRNADAARAQQEKRNKEQLALKAKYTPDGFNADIRDVEIEAGSVDLVLTDPPYLLSNDGFTLRSGKEASVNKDFEDARGVAIAPDEWVPIVAEWLKPGGVLVATCTLHILRELFNASEKAGLDIEREQAIWYKPGSPPQLSPTLLQPDFEYIFIAFKPGESSYFGYEDYRAKYKDQPSRTFKIPQCSGNERLGWHTTQKPLELFQKLITLYCPVDGLVVDPFSGSGTAPVAAKTTARRSCWIEKGESHYIKAEGRIANTPFHWES
jgi:site-specific DNA-methyltransferase (adenine-specific)